MIARLLGAVQFLTVIPVRRPTAPPGACAAFFPWIGACTGAAGAALYLGILSLPNSGGNAALAALLVLGFWTVIGGGLHEDGLADVADAVRAHRPPEKILAILKDSRIGTYGALALIFATGLQWLGLLQFGQQQLDLLHFGAPWRLAAALAAAQALPRAALVLLAWTSRPVGDGLGAAFQKDLTRSAVWIAVASGVAIALTPGLRLGLVTLILSGLVVLNAHRWFHARLGGVNGDCLGATAHAVQTVILVTYAFPFFTR